MARGGGSPQTKTKGGFLTNAGKASADTKSNTIIRYLCLMSLETNELSVIPKEASLHPVFHISLRLRGEIPVQ